MVNPRRWSTLLLDPVLIVGTVLSVVLGVLFYVRSDINTALGVFAGLLGVVIALQVQSVLLMHKRISITTKSGRIMETAVD
jgi:hypothetical protein